MNTTAKKRIVILVLGAEENRELLNCEIEPGTTAQNLLSHFNLQGYVLRAQDESAHLSGDQVLWSLVADGGKMWAVPLAEVGVAGIRGLLKWCGLFSASTPTSSNLTDDEVVSDHSVPPAETVKSAVVPKVRLGGRICPAKTPLWKERGWKERGKKLVGSFRTAKGGFRGEIVLQGGDAGGSEPSYYVFNPPGGVLSSSHGACWRRRGNNRFWVHFNSKAPLDAGISEIESQLSAYE